MAKRIIKRLLKATLEEYEVEVDLALTYLHDDGLPIERYETEYVCSWLTQIEDVEALCQDLEYLAAVMRANHGAHIKDHAAGTADLENDLGHSAVEFTR